MADRSLASDPRPQQDRHRGRRKDRRVGAPDTQDRHADQGRPEPHRPDVAPGQPAKVCQRERDQEVDGVRLHLRGMTDRIEGRGEDRDGHQHRATGRHPSAESPEQQQRCHAREVRYQPQRPFARAQELDHQPLGPEETRRHDLEELRRSGQAREVAREEVHGDECLIPPERKGQRVPHRPPDQSQSTAMIVAVASVGQADRCADGGNSVISVLPSSGCIGTGRGSAARAACRAAPRA